MGARGRASMAVAALAVLACGASDFHAVSLIETVRILATSADKPYAHPGDVVTVTVLAHDGRRDTSRPMRVSWIPTPCINPAKDAYYACFGALTGRASGGGGGPALKPGVDLTPFLPSGPSFSFTMPANIIATHPPVAGTTEAYGLAILFNIACAGHLEIVAPVEGDINPQSVPLGCFDDDHNRLGADDYVVGFTRVYAYAKRTNTNPVIDHVSFEGAPVDLAAGITVDRCTLAKHTDCPPLKLEVFVPETSQEVVPDETDGRREQVWVDFYATDGEFESGARLLYDATKGKLPSNDVSYFAPKDPLPGTIWVVAHDNRGGASWVEIPLHVR